MNAGTGGIHPISSLTPYQNKWTIKARVSGKSEILSYSNSRGEGRYFSLDLVDESGEIRATVFNDQVDRFHNRMDLMKVYYISKARIKTTDKRFSSKDYELTFSYETEVTECHESTDSIPMRRFDFKDIASLRNIPPRTIVDVIGICKNCSDIQTIRKQATNEELKKREVYLLDKSHSIITLALWNDQAKIFDGSSNPVIAIKGVQLSDYNGCSLSSMRTSTILINPDIPEAHALTEWYLTDGANVSANSLTASASMSYSSSAWKTLAQVNIEQLGHGVNADYFTTKAMITVIKKENCLYQACPKEGCLKKVQDLQDGNYRCEKCQQDYPNHSWRLLVQINISDLSDSIWATCFQENAEIIRNHIKCTIQIVHL